MSDYLNSEKPTEKEISDWVENKLDGEKMKKITASLLMHKDKDTQELLQKILAPEEPIFSNLEWVKKTIKEIFERKQADLKEMMLQLQLPPYQMITPLVLSKESKKQKETHQVEFKDYEIEVNSSSDFQLTIKIPKGRFLITTVFVNSDEEMGFMYPNYAETSKISFPNELEKLVIEGPNNIPLVKKGKYEVTENEVHFIVTQCNADTSHLTAFSNCVQKMEELGVIKWLRYIKQSEEGNFKIANIRFRLKKS